MRILISAAETSSDAHGAELLKAIREEMGKAETLEVYGIGGPKLQSAGLTPIVDARELLAMGFTEILGRLPRVYRALNQVTEAASKARPDIAIVIDYPDFHFRLARRLNQLGIPMVYYIPPKVWAWRKGRVETLRKFFVRILCILPFEELFYKDLNVPVKYVGNPLVDELPLDLAKSEARQQLSLGQADKVLVLMPGSRASELKGHLEIMLEAAAMAAERLRSQALLKESEKLRVLMPFPVTVQIDPILQTIHERFGAREGSGSAQPFSQLLDIQPSHGNAAQCLVAADAGLIKSGTSTLEAGLLKCPHAVVYKPTRTTAWIFKNLIRYRGPVGLVNLVANWQPGRPDDKGNYLAREILCEEVTVQSLSDEIVALMTDQEKREKMLRGFDLLREKVCGRGVRLSPSTLAAKEVMTVLREVRSKPGSGAPA